MGKRAKSTLRKGWRVVVNSNLPKAVGDHTKVGDTGTITGRYKPNCWPYNEVYTVLNDRSQIEIPLHVDYIDQL